MSDGSDPNGGYLVTPAVSNRAMMIVRESSPLRELATVESLTSSELELPIDEDEADAHWAGATHARAATPAAPVGLLSTPVRDSHQPPIPPQNLREHSRAPAPPTTSTTRVGGAEVT